MRSCHGVRLRFGLLIGVFVLASVPLLLFDLPGRWIATSQLPWVPQSDSSTRILPRNASIRIKQEHLIQSKEYVPKQPVQHIPRNTNTKQESSARTTVDWSEAESTANHHLLYAYKTNSSMHESAPIPRPDRERKVYMMNYENLVFGSRQVTVDKACSRMLIQKPARCEERAVRTRLLHTKRNEITFCPIEKNGSTFWKRILHIVGGWGNETNPKHIAAKDVNKPGGGYKSLKTRSWTKINAIFNKTTSVMFVRNPYTKLFSGWLDKFVSTNPYFWKKFGKRIIQKERPNATKHSLICGHDVTFAEFLNFILSEMENKTCTEMHFTPNYNHCFPCNLTFDYIGKYETLKTDTLFLLEKLNLSHKVIFDDFENDAVGNAINESVKWVYRKKREITHCISFRCGLFRVWKRLQSRGIIGIEVHFPIATNQEADDLNAHAFEKMLTYAHEHSDPNMLKNNRREAIAEAFGQLTIDLRNRVIERFKIDFEMFGYDTDPKYLRKQPLSGHRYLLDACAEEPGSLDSLLFSIIDDVF